MSTSPEDPAATARALRLAVGRLSRRMRRLFTEAGDGLAFLELGVLDHLERYGPTSAGDLSSGEGVTTPAIAATLRHLESVGFVARSRDAADRRRVIVSITGAGRRSLRERDTAVLARLQEAVRDGLAPAERQQLLAAIPLLEKVGAQL
jgi:DNA-binding MarR family transcriptional regulator